MKNNYQLKEKHILSVGFNRGLHDVLYKKLNTSIAGGPLKKGEIRMIAIVFNDKINDMEINLITSIGGKTTTFTAFSGVVETIKDFKTLIRIITKDGNLQGSD